MCLCMCVSILASPHTHPLLPSFPPPRSPLPGALHSWVSAKCVMALISIRHSIHSETLPCSPPRHTSRQHLYLYLPRTPVYVYFFVAFASCYVFSSSPLSSSIVKSFTVYHQFHLHNFYAFYAPIYSSSILRVFCPPLYRVPLLVITALNLSLLLLLRF